MATFGFPQVGPGGRGRQSARGQVSRVPGQAEALGNQEKGIPRRQEHPHSLGDTGRNPKERSTERRGLTQKSKAEPGPGGGGGVGGRGRSRTGKGAGLGEGVSGRRAKELRDVRGGSPRHCRHGHGRSLSAWGPGR